MKFTVPVEVTGIKTVVVDRSLCWARYEDQWILESPPTKELQRKTDHQMKEYITTKLESGHRGWVSGDTLNIVPTCFKRCPVGGKEPPLETILSRRMAQLARALNRIGEAIGQ